MHHRQEAAYVHEAAAKYNARAATNPNFRQNDAMSAESFNRPAAQGGYNPMGYNGNV